MTENKPAEVNTRNSFSLIRNSAGAGASEEIVRRYLNVFFLRTWSVSSPRESQAQSQWSLQEGDVPQGKCGDLPPSLPPSLPLADLTDLLFRLLSQSVHQTLKQLQKEQYEARVAQLVKRNRVFYRSFYFSVLFLFFSIPTRIRNSMKTSFQFHSGDKGYASLVQPLW